MVPSIGVPELLVVLMILVVVFGGARLPQIGDALGRAARSLKRGLSSDDRIAVRPTEDSTKLTPAPATKSAASATAPPRSAGAGPSEDEIADADIVEKKS